MVRRNVAKLKQKSNAKSSDPSALRESTTTKTNEANETKRQLWFAAVKPPMYTVAITPMTVGSLAYYADTGHLSMSTMLMLLLMAVAIIAWLNITNDVFDFDTGVDKNKAESLVNLCGGTRKARHAFLFLGLLFLAGAFTALSSLCRVGPSFDPVALYIMGLAVFGGYCYQSPPFRLSYYGLGEPIAFVTWILGVTAAYYTQMCAHDAAYTTIMFRYPSTLARLQFILLGVLPSKSHALLPAAILVAFPTAIILFCSHFHQEEDDRRVGKMSPIVRLGVRRAGTVLWFALIIFIILHPMFYFLGSLSWQTAGLCLLTLPRMFHLGTFVNARITNPSTLRGCKYIAVRLHFVHGMLLSIGLFVVGRSSYSPPTLGS